VNERIIATFIGPVQCRRQHGASRWRIAGVDRIGGAPLDVFLSGGTLPALPAQLADAEVLELGDSPARRWQLRAVGLLLDLPVRTMQVHRGTAGRFERSIPGQPASALVRSGWLLLLNLLRLPGMLRLLRMLRG
jgi:hypothetical protein